MTVLHSYNPLNQSLVGEVPIACEKSIKQAVSASRSAQNKWAKLSLSERTQHLKKAYQTLHPQLQKLSELISLEMGKDQRRAGYEVQGTVQNAGYFIDEAASAFASEALGGGASLQYKPLGVVAVISPWNYPLAMANNLIIPALVAGNSVILKPSEHTPLVAELFVNTLQSALPKDVIQILHGAGDVGAQLVKSDINMVAFTGSMQTGRHIMANAAPKLKRLVMELGGNDPMIVMHNADVQAAARFAVASAFENAGQMCTSTERVYVDARVADTFYRYVTQIAQQYRVGPWDQAGVNIGPIANPAQHQKVLAQLKDAEQKGARFLLGQAHYDAPFIQPTVIADLSDNMQLECEETFAPILAIAEFTSHEQALARANNSDYGLGAVVFGGAGAAELAEQLEAGMVAVNQGVGGPGPWVGAKQSGFGFHGGKAGHRQFAQVRVFSA